VGEGRSGGGEGPGAVVSSSSLQVVAREFFYGALILLPHFGSLCFFSHTRTPASRRPVSAGPEGRRHWRSRYAPGAQRVLSRG
jgi:hypothetical protein